MNNGSQYNSDYFLKGQELGISGYTNYKWMPDLTIPMAASIVSHCNIKTEDSILDFGCARGYTVRAFRELGYSAWGYDISQWALLNADESVKINLIANKSTILYGSFDWVIAKDVLEHIPQVADTVAELMSVARTGIFAVVPLSDADGDKYVIQCYEKDVTHIHRLTLASWVHMFMQPGWSVTASYRVPGVKDNYKQYARGNGFIIACRIET